MGKAEKLLLNKRLKVYEVAEMVGYTDYRYFARLFSNYSGVTPDMFRKKHIR